MTKSYFDQVLQVLDASATGYTADRSRPVSTDEIDLSMGELRVSLANALRDLVQPSWRDDELRYSAPAGTPALRMAYLAALGADLGQTLPLTESSIVVTSGGKQALWLALGCTTRPGDTVLVPHPGWAPYRLWVEALGAKAETYDACSSSSSYLVERMAASRAGTVIVNSPCNPTGAQFTQAGLDAVADYAAASGTSLVSDEVYRHFADNPASLAPHVGGSDRRVLVADAVSKWAAAAGLRIGFLLAHPNDVCRAIALRSMVDSCPPGVTQRMAARLLAPSMAPHRSNLRRWVRGSVQALSRVLVSEGATVRSQGGLYVWVRRQHSADRIVLQSTGTVLRGAPGALFGDDGHVRLCPATDAPEVGQLLGGLAIE